MFIASQSMATVITYYWDSWLHPTQSSPVNKYNMPTSKFIYKVKEIQVS